MGSFGGFFMYLLVVQPATAYFLRKKDWSFSKRMAAAIAFLAAVAAYDLYPQIAELPAGLYQTLQVPTTGDSSAIRHAYRESSRRYHPDKLVNPTPEEKQFATVQFEAIQLAYEVLNHPTKRDIYDRFGLEGVVKMERSSDDAVTMFVFESALFYVVWGVLTYLLTLFRRGSPLARRWAYTGLASVAAFEGMVKFGGTKSLTTILPYIAESQKVAVLHLLVPAFVTGCSILASMLYVDPDALVQAQLHDIRGAIAALQKQLVVMRDELADPTKPRVPMSSEKKSAVDAQLRNRAPPHTRRGEAPPKKGGIPSWAIMVGLYVLFNYVLK